MSEKIRVELNYLKHTGDGFTERYLLLKRLPRVGECVHIRGDYHRVIDVVYYPESEEQQIILHIGESAQSPEEARSKGYGLWNS